MMNHVNLICLGVKDIKESLAFNKGIGFQTNKKESKPLIVFFNNQGSKLELYPIEELAKDISAMKPAILSKDGFSGITLACNMKLKNEVDELMALVMLFENLGIFEEHNKRVTYKKVSHSYLPYSWCFISLFVVKKIKNSLRLFFTSILHNIA
ncbi:hypothetical protein GCM10025886_14880 [Tetragenococcus halophilus subsp. flandriensis]|uniref:hypothetical protein n=1 Tax=Tetragenococcus halophilus TaxID=51669 RepID=UPI0023E96873|nr:hypothetical protein [Tetragenococcus halophilus]GMA08337.1 hypothetical protein GCM10025886_14880 [Tetragenococcus halophilus subsp. flandriensis]